MPPPRLSRRHRCVSERLGWRRLSTNLHCCNARIDPRRGRCPSVFRRAPRCGSGGGWSRSLFRSIGRSLRCHARRRDSASDPQKTVYHRSSTFPRPCLPLRSETDDHPRSRPAVEGSPLVIPGLDADVLGRSGAPGSAQCGTRQREAHPGSCARSRCPNASS